MSMLAAHNSGGRGLEREREPPIVCGMEIALVIERPAVVNSRQPQTRGRSSSKRKERGRGVGARVRR